MKAGLVAAAVSGLPSTAYALATGRDPLEATKAAGALLVGERAPTLLQVAAAGPVHLSLSLAWAAVLERALPRHRRVLWGAAGGLAIAALDLGVIGGGRRSGRCRFSRSSSTTCWSARWSRRSAVVPEPRYHAAEAG